MGQGLRRLGSFVGLVLGPLWGGATVRNPLLQMAIPLILLVIMAVSIPPFAHPVGGVVSFTTKPPNGAIKLTQFSAITLQQVMFSFSIKKIKQEENEAARDRK